MPDYGARIIIEGDAKQVVAEFEKLKRSLGGIATGTKGAAAGLGKMEGPLRSFSQGNISGGLQGIASALGPIGIGAGIAATAIFGLVKAYDAQVERGRALINATDDLADRFQLSAQEGQKLGNFMQIMSVDAGTLNVAFRTMAKNGIEPSLEGLREVKTRLDALDSPAQRTAETVKLLGRSGLELAETLGLSNDEFDRLIKLAGQAASITNKVTDAQDAYNREIASYKVIQQNANIIATRGGLGTKEAIVSSIAELAALEAVKRGLASLNLVQAEAIQGNVAYDTSLEVLNAVLVEANRAKENGITLTYDQAKAIAFYTDKMPAHEAASRSLAEAWRDAKQPFDAAAAAAKLIDDRLRAIKSSVLGLTAQDWKIRISAAISGEDQVLLNWLMGGQQGTRSSFSGFGQGGGGGGSTTGGGQRTLASWASAADRAYAAAHPDQFKAEGGNVRAGQSYIVGERGAETFVPRENGTIIPNGANNSRSVNITGPISIANGMDLAEFESMLRQSLRGVR